MNQLRNELVGALLLVGAVLLQHQSSSASAPAGRYAVASGIVTDKQTGLAWQQVHDPNTKSFGISTTHCANLNLNGKGWRVPSMKELMTLVDDAVKAPAIDRVAFPNTPSSDFWTSSTTEGNAYVVSFEQGGARGDAVTSSHFVRCVR
jgi:hypothetical protein